MRLYSAMEAIGPAWEHTVRLLWRPRRWGTLIKVAFVALLASVGNSFSTNLPSNLRDRAKAPGSAAVKTALLGLTIFGALIGFAIALIFLYLGSRLQLVLFELVARRQTTVAPAWSYHGRRTWRWIGAKLPLLLALVAALVPASMVLSRLAAHTAPDPAHPFAFVRLLLPFLGWVFLAGLLIGTLLTALRDFGLPSIALEDAGVGETYRRIWNLVRADTGEVLLYVLLRILLGVAAGVAGYLAVGLATAVSGIPLAVLGLLVWLPLHVNPAGRIVSLGVIGLLSGILLLWAMLLAVIFIGTLLVFYQAWSIYFLGGRYPLLGNLVEPPIAVPVWTPPPSLPEDDDDSGPNLPMDPVPV